MYEGFYGEGYEVLAGKTFTRKADERPYGGVVWSGNGKINGNEINAVDNEKKEFLVTPGHDALIEAGTQDLKLYVVFPLE